MNGVAWQHNWREPVEQVTARLGQSIEAHRLPEVVQVSLNRWSSGLQGGLQGTLTQPMADWLQAHPLLAWGIDHPLWTLAGLFVVLLLLSGLLQAIARFTEQIWIWILRSPVLLIQWLVAIGLRWMQRKPAAPIATPKQQRLTVILQKLEAMRQEQEELLKEVRALLVEDSHAHD